MTTVLGIYAAVAMATNLSFPTTTSEASVVVASGSNWVDAVPFTNTFWWGATNHSTGSTVGPQYAVAVDTNWSIAAADSQIDFCSLTLADHTIYTTWRGSGKTAVQLTLVRDNVSSTYSVGVNCTTNASGGTYNWPYFSNFVASYLLNPAWTNFVAKTNGRQSQLWAAYVLPSGWPLTHTNPPTLVWSNTCLIYGATGQTAISQCNTVQGARGQVPMTALTRRHLYARGHGMGTNGLAAYAGVKVYFCTTSNTVVEVATTNRWTRTGLGGDDFTIVGLATDLPDSITPLRVINEAEFVARYPFNAYAPQPILKTSQTGKLDCGYHASSGTAFWENTYPGDSGSVRLLWLDNELFMVGGVSSTGPSDGMNDALTAISDALGLSTNTYHLNYLDVSSYPTYP